MRRLRIREHEIGHATGNSEPSPIKMAIAHRAIAVAAGAAHIKDTPISYMAFYSARDVHGTGTGTSMGL